MKEKENKSSMVVLPITELEIIGGLAYGWSEYVCMYYMCVRKETACKLDYAWIDV